eukprot:CAMPEP_0172162072 /NCGR_PEP_ID=MMETSP1050-20130122/6465_1 /TAXON_ID=233186 /ORGANISM="Cryptomonas curvata, Strain CCAP979/52" /LENGTH=119 /DNA_ID=CAMNT_0012832015 /DNA_START=187 /DNA_END=543 /DNA_ORIENTATION=-
MEIDDGPERACSASAQSCPVSNALTIPTCVQTPIAQYLPLEPTKNGSESKRCAHRYDWDAFMAAESFVALSEFDCKDTEDYQQSSQGCQGTGSTPEHVPALLRLSRDILIEVLARADPA